MFCITVFLASCMHYAISFVLLLVQDMRQNFLIKCMNILAARKQLSHQQLLISKTIYFFVCFNRFFLHWTTCVKLTLEGLYDFAEMLYFFSPYLFILCFYCTAFSSFSFPPWLKQGFKIVEQYWNLVFFQGHQTAQLHT